MKGDARMWSALTPLPGEQNEAVTRLTSRIFNFVNSVYFTVTACQRLYVPG
jgi:hypothetical protein